MKKRPLINWKLFWILFGASVFSVIAAIPYILTLQADFLKELPTPLHVLLPVQILLNAVMFGVFIFIGLYLAKRIGFGAPILEGWLSGGEIRGYLKSVLSLSIALGILVAVLIIGVDSLWSIFIGPRPIVEVTLPPTWQRFLMCFYGGIGEEVIMRLFLMTLLVWIFCKIGRVRETRPLPLVIQLAIVVSAILFGVAHLPFAAALTQLTALVTARIVLLNSIAGIAFGWLYWKKGLESAMLSHFSADIVSHVVFPLFV